MSYTGASGASYSDRSPAQTAPPSSTQVSCLGWLCMCLQQLLLQLLHREPHNASGVVASCCCPQTATAGRPLPSSSWPQACTKPKLQIAACIMAEAVIPVLLP